MSENENTSGYQASSGAGTSVFGTLRRELLSLLTLNLMFILSCLPIITIPAAITSMSRITGMMVQDQNYYLWGDYIKTFKREFLRSLAGGAVFAVALALFLLAGLVYFSIFGRSMLFVVIAGFTACLIILVLMASVYFWTMTAFVNLPVKSLLKNSLIMVFGCWKRTLPALLVVFVQTFFGIGLAPVGIGRITALTDIWVFGVFLIMFSLNNLLINFAIWPAIYEKVIRREEGKGKPSATALHSREALRWEETPEELQSAGTDSLKWD